MLTPVPAIFTNNISSNYATAGDVYNYGNYYNWYSVTAGHGIYNKSSGDVVGDICPISWHLPTGNTTGEYYALNTALNSGATDSVASSMFRSYPNNFVYSGSAYFSVGGRSSYGYYWSSSADGNDRAYTLYLGSSYIDPGTSNSTKYYGRVARCISDI